jgi:DNA-binding transcriptional MerR regulator
MKDESAHSEALAPRQVWLTTSAEYYDTQSAATLCRLSVAEVQRYVEEGAIEAVWRSNAEPLLDEEALYWLRKIARLRRDFGINVPAAPLVVDLLRRIEALEERLRQSGQL